MLPDALHDLGRAVFQPDVHEVADSQITGVDFDARNAVAPGKPHWLGDLGKYAGGADADHQVYAVLSAARSCSACGSDTSGRSANARATPTSRASRLTWPRSAPPNSRLRLHIATGIVGHPVRENALAASDSTQRTQNSGSSVKTVGELWLG